MSDTTDKCSCVIIIVLHFLFQTHHHHQFNILKFGVEGAIIFHQILHKKIAYCCFPKHIVISAYCNICSLNFTMNANNDIYLVPNL